MNYKPEGKFALKTELETLLNDTLGMRRPDGEKVAVKHASVQKPRNVSAGQQKPHPIMARLDIDGIPGTDKLIRDINKAIKSKAGRFKGVLVTDDVCIATREKRRQLIPRMLELREQDLIAFIPFSTPARIVYMKNRRWQTETSTPD